MTPLEETLLKIDDFFKSIKLDYFLHGSTLLGIVRDKRILDRPFGEVVAGHIIPLTQRVDKEHNFGCLAEDLTNEKVEAFKKHWQWVDIRDNHFGNSLIFFGDQYDKYKTSLGPFGMEQGFGLLAKFYRTKTKRVEDMGNNLFKWWPPYHLDDKSKWAEVEILGRKFKAPYQYKKWFAHYFGPDWRTEETYWHWIRDACNLTHLQNLKKEGEIC